jgi:8-hydroxy-5-deazaflavin:NADPH oxidoreductase
MKIGIIGTGRMGSGLGKLWAAKGHQIMFGSRDADQANEVAGSIPNASGGTQRDAVAFGPVILLAVPWRVAVETIKEVGPLEGKTLIDLTNPVGEGRKLAVGFTSSAAEEIQKAATGAHVVKAFNTVHYGVLPRPIFDGVQADVFYAGDNADAKATVLRLIQDTGFNPVDAGPLQNARLLEPLTILWMQLAFVQGQGPTSIFKLLKG